MGASFLTTLGRPDWVAADESAYVQVAARLTGGAADLRQSRAALRAHMAASPLCDVESYVEGLQGLLRGIWKVHCAAE